MKAHGALVRGGDAKGLHWSASAFIQHQAGEAEFTSSGILLIKMRLDGWAVRFLMPCGDKLPWFLDRD